MSFAKRAMKEFTIAINPSDNLFVGGKSTMDLNTAGVNGTISRAALFALAEMPRIVPNNLHSIYYLNHQESQWKRRESHAVECIDNLDHTINKIEEFTNIRNVVNFVIDKHRDNMAPVADLFPNGYEVLSLNVLQITREEVINDVVIPKGLELRYSIAAMDEYLPTDGLRAWLRNPHFKNSDRIRELENLASKVPELDIHLAMSCAMLSKHTGRVDQLLLMRLMAMLHENLNSVVDKGRMPTIENALDKLFDMVDKANKEEIAEAWEKQKMKGTVVGLQLADNHLIYTLRE